MTKVRFKAVLFTGGFLLLSSPFLTGCSLLSDWWRQDEIAEYGETVFRKQNLITSQVMMLSESELSLRDQQKLQQAEAQMQKECHLLNQYASREMDAETIDLLFRKQVKDSIKGCELSIQQIEATLIELGIKE
jgi:hypothetical protein